jgi:hypothetical protein
MACTWAPTTRSTVPTKGDHTVRRCTLDGKVLLQIGVPGEPAPHMSGIPFHRCTHTALSPRGDIYVADGYGNARVHKYSPDGKLLMSWGEPGTDTGTVQPCPQCLLRCRRLGLRRGSRKPSGAGVRRQRGLRDAVEQSASPLRAVHAVGPQAHLLHRRTGSGAAVNLHTPNLGARVSIVTNEGKLLARLGTSVPGHGPGQFMSPHGLSVDSHGDIYVGEVSFTSWPRYHPGTSPPADLRTLQKWKKGAAALSGLDEFDESKEVANVGR